MSRLVLATTLCAAAGLLGSLALLSSAPPSARASTHTLSCGSCSCTSLCSAAPGARTAPQRTRPARGFVRHRDKSLGIGEEQRSRRTPRPPPAAPSQSGRSGRGDTPSRGRHRPRPPGGGLSPGQRHPSNARPGSAIPPRRRGSRRRRAPIPSLRRMRRSSIAYRSRTTYPLHC